MGKSKHINPAWEEGLPSGIIAKNNLWESKYFNEQVYAFYYDWLIQLSCSRFTWQNLPKEIDVRYLELSLNGNACAGFYFNEDVGKFMALRATPAQKINPYANPTAFTVWGSDGFSKRLNARNMVAIWNNFTRTPTAFALQIYARKLANIDRTIENNLAQQRVPPILVVSEEQRLTVENLLKQAYGGEPVIVGDNNSLTGIDATYIIPNTPYISDKLSRDKMLIWNEIITFLGINNTNVDKKERVQAAEVDANNSQIDTSSLMFLDTRRWACEEINRKYDLDVWVDAATDFSSENFAAIMAAPAGRFDYDGI